MNWRHLHMIVMAAVCVGCSGAPVVKKEAPPKLEVEGKETKNVDDALYFQSPSQAVPIISELLIKKDWATLTRYYDLQGSGIDRGELESGAFFIREKPPEVGHPGGFWRYKHPFPPSFKYESDVPVEDGVNVVTTAIEIDQGGGMMQRGMSHFKMRKSDGGWRILPGPAEPPRPVGL